MTIPKSIKNRVSTVNLPVEKLRISRFIRSPEAQEAQGNSILSNSTRKADLPIKISESYLTENSDEMILDPGQTMRIRNSSRLELEVIKKNSLIKDNRISCV